MKNIEKQKINNWLGVKQFKMKAEMNNMSVDKRGIYLSEINYKYPQSCQPLGYDVLLDTDVMYKPKVISSFELCVNSILTLLFMKPGQYPSIPELGIDIESYLHEYSDDTTIPTEIKNKIETQCNRINMTGIAVEVYFEKMSDNNNALVIEISGSLRLTKGSESNQVIIGISYDKLNRLYIRKRFRHV